MTKRRQFKHQCKGKKKRTKYEANRSAELLSSRVRGEKLEPYECPHCGWFHIGHRPESGEKEA